MPSLSMPQLPLLRRWAVDGQVARRRSRNDPPGLLAPLAKVTDPRQRRGIRHRLVVILALAVCAVLAVARSFTAIAGRAADADEKTLARPG
jgi:DDE_Tnp_1-associated